MLHYLLLIPTLAFVAVEAKPCGICTPCQPVCAPRPICPVRMCPPMSCPMPPPCPPPPPPPPCPPCLHPVIPVPVPVPRPVPVPISRPVPVPVPIANQCCSTCGMTCFVRRKRAAVAESDIPLNDTTLVEPGSSIDAVCSNKVLRAVMIQSMTSDPQASQRRIQGAAETKLGRRYSVLCVKGDFSYSAYTSNFCQHKQNGVACYAFQT